MDLGLPPQHEKARRTAAMTLTTVSLAPLRLPAALRLTPEQQRRFAPLCPDRVVELASPTDEGPRGLTALRRKMEAYRSNGARLGWLLIPHERAVEVWPASGLAEIWAG
jgi:Uma2 family endonuclease